MLKNTAALKAIGRTGLACCLCLLAFAFAVEAKTAWYGPAAGPGSDVRAAKALPASLPRLVPHGFPLSVPVHPRIPVMLMAASFTAWFAGANIQICHNSFHSQLQVSSAAFFSPHLFFRPPPSRS